MNGLFFFCRGKCHSLILHPRMVFDFVYTVDNGRGCVSNSIWAVNYYCSFIFVAYFNSNFDGAFKSYSIWGYSFMVFNYGFYSFF